MSSVDNLHQFYMLNLKTSLKILEVSMISRYDMLVFSNVTHGSS